MGLTQKLMVSITPLFQICVGINNSKNFPTLLLLYSGKNMNITTFHNQEYIKLILVERPTTIYLCRKFNKDNYLLYFKESIRANNINLKMSIITICDFYNRYQFYELSEEEYEQEMILLRL